jgi:hypothetical protein
MGSNLQTDQDLQTSARRACKDLHFFAKVFPLAKPDAWRSQGLYDWQVGDPRKAYKAWQKSLAHAHEQENSYQQGLTHIEIGRHLSAGERTEDGRAQREHLQYAVEVLSDLGATYDLKRANAALQGFS